MKSRKLDDLLRVYHDLERTLRHLKKTAEKNLSKESSLRQIDVRKLIAELSHSKRRLERKIGNTLLLEKQYLKRRLRVLAHNLSQKPSES